MQILVILVALIFGAADQYLGSLSAHGWGVWTVAVSQMSASWLFLPFLAGRLGASARRAMILGLLVTYAGLLGYFVMTLSPVEGVSLAHVHLIAFLRSQALLIVGGVLSGPLFGYLGYRWRAARSWVSALVMAGAACLEPLARLLAGELDPPSVVWPLEIVAGAAIGAYFAAIRTRYRRGSSRATSLI